MWTLLSWLPKSRAASTSSFGWSSLILRRKNEAFHPLSPTLSQIRNDDFKTGSRDNTHV
jgi:hypothetical protein